MTLMPGLLNNENDVANEFDWITMSPTICLKKKKNRITIAPLKTSVVKSSSIQKEKERSIWRLKVRDVNNNSNSRNATFNWTWFTHTTRDGFWLLHQQESVSSHMVRKGRSLKAARPKLFTAADEMLLVVLMLHCIISAGFFNTTPKTSALTEVMAKVCTS